MVAQLGHGRPGQPVRAPHVDPQQLTVRSASHPGGATDQLVVTGRAGHGDDEALPCLPRFGDPMTLAVVLQPRVDLIGDPQQCQLAQGRQVAGPEVVRQCGVDLLGAVDVAVGHPPAQRLRGHVDELDLVGGPHDMVGDRLALRDPGDPLDEVVHRLQVLHVHGRDDVDAGGEQVIDVLPPLGVTRTRDVGVGELVDQRDLRAAGQHGVDVQFLERRAPILDAAAGDHLEIADLLGGPGPAVGLHQTDDHVGARARACAVLR